MESTDKTVEIAKNLNVSFFNFPKSNYVEPAREFGISKVKTEWVFILDADERITEELAEEIIKTMRSHPQGDQTFYKIPRKNIFGRIKWLRHGGWWPDYQIRLISKKHFVNWPKQIHSTPQIQGRLGYLKNPLTHNFHGDLTNMIKKTVVFEDIESDLLYKANKNVSTATFFRKFLAELYRRLIKSLGFLDGTVGIIESIYQAFSKTITYLFLYEKSKDKKIKVGIYDPFLDTLGGGEKYIFSILEVLAEKGYEINVFWNKDLSKEINGRFALKSIGSWKWLPNIFKRHPERSRGIFNKISRLVSLARNDNTFINLKKFDYFFYVTDGSYFFSSAKKNFVYAMVPDEKLYNLTVINRLKLANYSFITHSEFTKKWLKKFGIDSQVIMPYLDKHFTDQDAEYFKKDKIILSVGRFFPHLHSKKQDEMIRTFKLLKKSNLQFEDYKLILAGGLKKEDKKYFDYLKKLADNDSSIVFKPNIELYELYKLYELSNYFWHFAGYGVDENIHPEQVEHFGITPVEAMASGCLTFSYNAGGPKEIISEGENGFLFNSTGELIEKMITVENNSELKNKIRLKSSLYAKKRFSYKVFEDLVLKNIFANIRYG